jgi:hypothetical protein
MKLNSYQIKIIFLSLIFSTTISCEKIANIIPDNIPTRNNPEVTQIISNEKISIGKPILPSLDFIQNNSSQEKLDKFDTSVYERSLSIVRITIKLIDSNQKIIERNGNGVIIDRKNGILMTTKSLINLQELSKKNIIDSIKISLNFDQSDSKPKTFDAKIIPTDDFNVTLLRIINNPNQKQTKLLMTESKMPNFINVLPGDKIEIINFIKENNSDEFSISLTDALIKRKYSGVGKTYSKWLSTNIVLPNSYLGTPVFDQQGLLIGLVDQIRYNEDSPLTFITTALISGKDIESILLIDKQASTILNPTFNYLDNKENIIITEPVFSTNSIMQNGALTLYDYNFYFNDKVYLLYYQFFTQGLQIGDSIEEKWFWNDIHQENISSQYIWQANNNIITDSISFSYPKGIPKGIWTLEIHVNEQIKASSSLNVMEEMDKKIFKNFKIQSTFLNSNQLLLSFNYANTVYDAILTYILYSNGKILHESKQLTFNQKGDGIINIVYYDTNEEAMNSLDNLEVDFFINFEFVGNAKLNKGE